MNPEKWRVLLSQESREDPCVYPDMYEGTKKFFEAYLPQYLPPAQYRKILDLGCGCGIEVKVLEELGYEVMGITMSKADVDYAKSQFGLNILFMDMHDLNFPANHFDGAISRQSLEHAYSTLLVMLETRIVLKYGGRWFIDLPSPHNKDMWGGNHRSILYPTQMRRYFDICGFEIVKAEESSNQTLGYNGGGDPYRYIVQKGSIENSSHQKIIQALEGIHKNG